MSFKARLLFVSWIKVDGKLVYKAEAQPTDADQRDERDVRNTDVPATFAEPQAAAFEPARPRRRSCRRSHCRCACIGSCRVVLIRKAPTLN